MEITHDELVAAFTEWEREYREEPDKFMSNFARYSQSEEDYGDGAMRALIHYIERVRGAEVEAEFVEALAKAFDERELREGRL